MADAKQQAWTVIFDQSDQLLAMAAVLQALVATHPDRDELRRVATSVAEVDLQVALAGSEQGALDEARAKRVRGYVEALMRIGA